MLSRGSRAGRQTTFTFPSPYGPARQLRSHELSGRTLRPLKVERTLVRRNGRTASKAMRLFVLLVRPEIEPPARRSARPELKSSGCSRGTSMCMPARIGRRVKGGAAVQGLTTAKDLSLVSSCPPKLWVSERPRPEALQPLPSAAIVLQVPTEPPVLRQPFGNSLPAAPRFVPCRLIPVPAVRAAHEWRTGHETFLPRHNAAEPIRN